MAALETPGDDLAEAVRAAAASETPIPAVPPAVLDRLRRLPGDRARVAPPAPGERVGSYRLDRLLGRGGMGVVYLAHHDRTPRPVALKMLPPDPPADRLVRFRREAEAVAGLRHPNVVRVYEIGEADGRPFLVMEYVPGGTLAAKLAAGPLAPVEAAAVVGAAARGVAAAHAAGVVHRDLKPGNVLLDPVEGPKVADFGLVKAPAPGGGAGIETETGVLLGTPAYMAPEQAAGRASGAAADVYGLGAVLYECLTGRPPFAAASVLETLDSVRTRDPVPPRQLNPAVPRDLETVCLKCLEKDPTRRYAAAADLAADLGRFDRGEAVRARPVGPVRRAWKWARRRPTAAALVLTCGASAVALAAVVAVYTARLRQAAADARASAAAADASAAEVGRQQRRAETHYRAARDALQKLLGRLNDRRAAEIPRLKELRRAQLEDALAFYEGVLAGTDDPDPAVRLDAALARVEAGAVQFELGQAACAETIRRAAADLERLPPESRTRPDARAGLARCYGLLASLSRPENGPDAEAWFRKALAEAEGLLRTAPADPNYLSGVAGAEHNLGVLFQLRGQPAAAEPHYLRAIALREGLLDRQPPPAGVPGRLAESLLNLGLVYAQTGRAGPAAAAYERADRFLAPLAGTDDHYALSLAGVCVNWGNLLAGGGRFPDAVARLDRAVGLADAVLKREPELAAARQRATEAHGARAFTLAAAGRFMESAADWDRLVELTTGPTGSPYEAERAAALARAGVYARASAEAHALLATPPLPDDVRYKLAGALARCVEPARVDSLLGPLAGCAAAEVHAAAAVRQLRRIQAAGYFRTPATAKSLTDDPDLAALRGRADFRRLLADVAADPKRQ